MFLAQLVSYRSHFVVVNPPQAIYLISQRINLELQTLCILLVAERLILRLIVESLHAVVTAS
jgi:hypothetical protein